MYARGRGVPKDLTQAYMWYALAKAVRAMEKQPQTNPRSASARLHFCRRLEAVLQVVDLHQIFQIRGEGRVAVNAAGQFRRCNAVLNREGQEVDNLFGAVPDQMGS